MRSTIYAMALFLFCSICGKAQITHAVSVFTEQGENFTLILDGMKENATPQSRVDVTGLPNDQYTVKVIFDDPNVPNLDDKIHLIGVNGPMDVVYTVKKNNKGNYVLRINSFKAATGTTAANTNTETPPPPPNNSSNTVVNTTTTTTNGGGANINTTTDPNGGANVNMTVVDPNTGQTMVVNTSANPNGANVNINGATTTQTVVTKTTTTTTTSGDGYTSTPPPPPPVANSGCMYPMAWPDYEAAKKSITNQSFTEEQLKVAKQVTKSNCLSAEQVKGIMKLFSFEQTKLDYAKFAYDYTVDKNNYYKINDAFDFSTSVDDLNNYLQAKGH